MNSANPDWKPNGPRWLEKVECEKCSGVGLLVSGLEKLCDNCGGNGFVATSENDVILCPACQGERKVVVEVKSSCEDCCGRGYNPKIMQTFVATVECPECKGTGEIEGDDDEEECWTCEGSGREKHSDYCSLQKWRESPLNTHSGHKIGWTGNDLTDVYQLDSGAFVEIVPCKECVKPMGVEIPSKELFRIGCGLNFHRQCSVGSEEDENDESPDDDLDDDDSEEGDVLDEEICPFCEGLRKVVEITPKCNDCDGSGFIAVTEECPECGGEGKIDLSEEREV